ncbi:MAG TPA: EAL domain-containing protein [Anaerolineales bacterium]
MRETSRSRIPGELVRVALAFVLIIGLTLGAFSAVHEPRLRLVFSDVVPPVIELLIGAMLLVGARRMRVASAQLAGGWTFIAAAVLLYAAGDLVWAYYELLTPEPAFPSWADVLYLLYVPTFLLGAMWLIYPRISPDERAGVRLDLLTIFVTASLIFWNLLIGPVMRANAAEPLLNQLILCAYPVGDLVLLGALMLILHYQIDERELASTLILGAGIALLVLTDSIYVYQTLAGTYVGGTLLDTGWMAAHVLTGLAIVPHVNAVLRNDTPRIVEAQASHLRVFRAFRTYVPYGALLLAYIILLRGGADALAMTPLGLAVGVGIIVALVLLRQMTTLGENTDLTDQLVTKAAELEDINRNLAVQVTERQRIEEKLSYDTLHDTMTGLPNRVLFLELLQGTINLARRLRRDHAFSVLFIDVDHFKVVNDSLGHMVGDELLWAIGARLKGALRSEDTLARFGGDEFAILMDARAHAGAGDRLAERVQRSVQQAFRIEGHELHLTVSIGIVNDVAEYEQAEDLLRDADLAMYEAKSQGKSRAQSFAVRMRKRAFLRLDLEMELRKALTQDEIRVHYQPIVSLKTDKVAGMEALVRWQHPKRGLLRPRDFLTVAEESGLILRMGEQVLAAACEDMTRLQERHPGLGELGVSVNLSNKQFTQPGLIANVGAALRRTGLSPRLLKLEITERVLIENVRVANRVFDELNALGVRFEIDDFGTGYSALTYLQNFPLHALKIDKGFIEGMRRSRKGLGLVRAIINMAHEMGMETVAEGITTQAQLTELKALQCDYGQGILLQRPLAVKGLEAVLDRLEPDQPRRRVNGLARPRALRKNGQHTLASPGK